MYLIENDKYHEIVNTNSNVTTTLQNSGQEITIDDTKIQNDIQAVRDNSLGGLENQAILFLDRNTATISSEIGPVGTNSETVITSLPAPSQGLNFVDNNDSPRSKIIIGQAHGHPESNTPGYVTEKNMSDKDKNTAQSMQIPIYGLDAISGSGRSGNSANIHRANPNGTIDLKVGKTKGTGIGTYNIGKNAMELWGRSGRPIFY
jgi:hypothetical protein